MTFWAGFHDHAQANLFFELLLVEGENSTQLIFMKDMFKIGLRLDAYKPISFKLVLIVDTIIHFDSSVNDLDLHPRSQGYEKDGSCTVILLQNASR